MAMSTIPACRLVRRAIWTSVAIVVAGAGFWGVAWWPRGMRVEAAWQPIEESREGFAQTWDELKQLRPASAAAKYGASSFRALLAPSGTSVGDIWRLDADRLVPFLRQFHPGATVRLHHGTGSAPGAFACLRARGDRYDDIRFRLHAEFVLSDGRSFYTPAQFSGRLVFDRPAGQAAFFHLQLPPRNTNVDVNRFFPFTIVNGERVANVTSVDVGYSPRMELTGGDAALAERLAWPESISADQARERLAQQFYPFLAIRWLPWDAAVAESQQAGKPLHILALLGTLDDESC